MRNLEAFKKKKKAGNGKEERRGVQVRRVHVRAGGLEESLCFPSTREAACALAVMPAGSRRCRRAPGGHGKGYKADLDTPWLWH